MAAQAAQPAGGGQAEEPDSRRTAGVPPPPLHAGDDRTRGLTSARRRGPLRLDGRQGKPPSPVCSSDPASPITRPHGVTTRQLVRSGTSSSSPFLAPTATPSPARTGRSRSRQGQHVGGSRGARPSVSAVPPTQRGLRLPANKQTNKPAGRLSIRLASYFADLFVSSRACRTSSLRLERICRGPHDRRLHPEGGSWQDHDGRQPRRRMGEPGPTSPCCRLRSSVRPDPSLRDRPLGAIDDRGRARGHDLEGKNGARRGGRRRQ